jgi:hypothetical protein
MFSSHYYHGTVRKMVAVFGTLFNNISVVRKDANNKVVNEQRVPIAYGPKQKFLTRLDEQPDLEGNKIAIKLPRMSFEVIGMTYDPTMKINRNQKVSVPDTTDVASRKTVRTFAPYRVQMALSIMGKTQDDVLQILEQILPNFQPEYSVTIKDVEGLNIENDVPITLIDITPDDSYEGQPEDRRVILWTLTFEMRLRFYGPSQSRAVIKSVDARLIDGTTQLGLENINVHIDPIDAGEGDAHTIVQVITFLQDSTDYEIAVQSGAGTYTVGEEVLGAVSGTAATIVAYDNTEGILKVKDADGVFKTSESLVGQTSGCNRAISRITQIFA